jgi:uncharacterized protein YegP (UPF0339 family)
LIIPKPYLEARSRKYLYNLDLLHKKAEKLPEPKFELFRDKAGKFRFRLVAPNGETIAAGEAYSSKDACLRGIESVKKNAPIAKIVEVES